MVIILIADCFVLILEILELPDHPYFVGAQFHPEFKSRPEKPSALFLGNIPWNRVIFLINQQSNISYKYILGCAFDLMSKLSSYMEHLFAWRHLCRPSSLI